MNTELAKIIRNDLIALDTFEMEIEGFTNSKAGQFINIKTGDTSLLLRRPISVCEVKENSIVITYKVVGAGTKVLSEKKVNDYLDILKHHLQLLQLHQLQLQLHDL